MAGMRPRGIAKGAKQDHRGWILKDPVLGVPLDGQGKAARVPDLYGLYGPIRRSAFDYEGVGQTINPLPME